MVVQIASIILLCLRQQMQASILKLAGVYVSVLCSHSTEVYTRQALINQGQVCSKFPIVNLTLDHLQLS